MISEHDCIVLTEDVPAEGLQAGDVGTVVHIHPRATAYEVEFVTLTGADFCCANDCRESITSSQTARCFSSTPA